MQELKPQKKRRAPRADVEDGVAGAFAAAKGILDNHNDDDIIDDGRPSTEGPVGKGKKRGKFN